MVKTNLFFSLMAGFPLLMNKLSLLLILLILPLVLVSQKNFASDIEKGSYSKVIKKSEKLLLKESENIESLYFIAVIKSRKSAGKYYNPFDAYHYAIKSQNLFKNVQDFKSLEFFNKIPISYNKFVELLDSIGVNAYSDIENSNLPADFDFFLKTYAEIPKIYLDRAIIKKDHLVFEMAVSKNEVSALQDFIQENPNAIDRTLAITLRDRLAFSNAKNDGKLHAFEKFIADYPNAFQVDSAYHFIHDLAFEEANKTNTIEGYEFFILTYPSANQVNIVTEKIHLLAFDIAKTDDNSTAYKKFMIGYPNSEQASKAKELFDQREFQENTARIKEIDAMLFEIEELESIQETPGVISSYIEKVRDTTIIEDDREYVLRQRATKCQYSSTDFSTFQLWIFNRDDPFGGMAYDFYFKDNKLFFVSFGWGDGGEGEVMKIYYNSLEKPIKFLEEKSYVDNAGHQSLEEDEQKEILIEVQGSLDQILSILNQ